MDGWTIVIATGLGYASVPLVSLLTRKSWPEFFNFVFAVAFALGAAGLTLFFQNEAITRSSLLAGLGISFPAQAATWHLKLPGAGNERLNETLLEVPI